MKKKLCYFFYDHQNFIRRNTNKRIYLQFIQMNEDREKFYSFHFHHVHAIDFMWGSFS